MCLAATHTRRGVRNGMRFVYTPPGFANANGLDRRPRRDRLGFDPVCPRRRRGLADWPTSAPGPNGLTPAHICAETAPPLPTGMGSPPPTSAPGPTDSQERALLGGGAVVSNPYSTREYPYE